MRGVCTLYSGGKDSNYALHWAVLHGFRVCCLGVVAPRGWESTLFHYPAVELTALQAEALGLPRLLVSEEEAGGEIEALIALLRRCRSRGAEGVVSGALLSDYQRLRFAAAAEEVGLRSYTPLWRKNQEEYMRSLVREGFRVMVVSVQAYGLPRGLAGRVLDEGLVEEIIRRARRYGFNPAFEGGEAETLVLDAPLFRSRLEVRGEAKTLAPYHEVYEIREARLVPKPAGGGAGGEHVDEA
ncbi:MAG: diphthine--ammonia ligase [Crenarchaeota archaeon]|nr:diphthine--ammonia ligase [Thermoproteota archaeon]